MPAVSFKKPAANTNTATSAVQQPAANPATAARSFAQTTVAASVPANAQPVNAPAVAQGTAPVANSMTALTTPAASAVALAPNPMSGGIGGFEGEWNSKDLAVSYLSIFQKSAKNFDEHMDWLGHYVWGKDYDMGEEITVIFLRAVKYYVEKLPWGASEIPARFDRMEDARTAGFAPSQLQEVADLDLLIEVPADIEGVPDLAQFIVEDKAYLLARWSVRSTSYKVAKTLMRDASGWLKGCLFNGSYTLGTAKMTNGDNTWHGPTVKTGTATSEAVRAAVLENFS